MTSGYYQSSADLARGCTVTYHTLTQSDFEKLFGRKM